MVATNLNTSRLELRLVALSDLESVHTLLSRPEVDEFNTLGIPKNIEETRSILQDHLADLDNTPIKRFTFAVELKSNKQFIGMVAINLGSEKYNAAELWFKLHPSYWNNGYGTEAVKALVDFGFKILKLHRIEAGCAVQNIGSLKIMERVGMHREGRRKKALPLKCGWSDNYEYAILNPEH
ncbi:GNAT family N-acetyltransferase [Gillisia sp. M10.2A]|uniref:GNAT family N-acetyltransferase n=1 Tax=Gillisia lutea TaxID=2909668 RepID=A0ABS9EL15_9FLAO|nr:GNAT family N-acetyltransferase [Gillisia lutea]MCF4102539.1 GNAT family N-acetyltransferase [Gillisia lutea]